MVGIKSIFFDLLNVLQRMDGTEQPRQVLVKCVLVGDNAVRCICICIIV